MSDKSGHTLAELIRRWLKGETTASGEQELDRLAGADEFLADAMEGFRSLPEGRHEERLARIRSQVARRTRRSSSPLPLRRLAAAVAFVLLVAATLWWYEPGNEEVAINIPENPPATAQEELVFSPAESNESPAQPAPLPALPSEKRASKKPEVSAPIAQAEQSAPEEPNKPQFLEQAKEISAPSAATSPGVAQSDAKAAENAGAAPSPPAVSRSAPAQNASSPKANLLDSGAITAGEQKKRVENREAEAEEALSRMRPPVAYDAGADSREPMPAGGWEAFQTYVKKNLRYPAPARKKGIKGEVRVQFRIKADGSLSDLKILDSLGYGCDEEAIRLLRKGPAWERPVGKDPVVTSILIAFGI